MVIHNGWTVLVGAFHISSDVQALHWECCHTCHDMYRQHEQITSIILLTGILGKSRSIRCAVDFQMRSLMQHSAVWHVYGYLQSVHKNSLVLKHLRRVAPWIASTARESEETRPRNPYHSVRIRKVPHSRAICSPCSLTSKLPLSSCSGAEHEGILGLSPEPACVLSMLCCVRPGPAGCPDIPSVPQ